jgi:hypothetical protein
VPSSHSSSGLDSLIRKNNGGGKLICLRMKNRSAFFDRNIGNHLLQAARAAELCESCLRLDLASCTVRQRLVRIQG